MSRRSRRRRREEEEEEGVMLHAMIGLSVCPPPTLSRSLSRSRSRSLLRYMT